MGIPPRYVTKPIRSTQPCIPTGSLNRVPALIGCGKGGNVTSAGWQVTLCDPIWHVSFCSGEALADCCIPLLYLYFDVDGVLVVQRPEHVRITDFGLAKLLSNKQGTMFSTTGEKVTSNCHYTLLICCELQAKSCYMSGLFRSLLCTTTIFRLLLGVKFHFIHFIYLFAQ